MSKEDAGFIDWITAVVPFPHDQAIDGGNLAKISPSGEIEWSVRSRLGIEGSFSSTIQVRSLDYLPRHLQSLLEDKSLSHLLQAKWVGVEISGNPIKFFQGHNLWGSNNLIGLVAATLVSVLGKLGHQPSEDVANAWRSGLFILSRVDATLNFRLPSQEDVQKWLSVAANSSMTNRGRGESYKDNTVYWGKGSRRWTLKAYSKYDEMISRNHLSRNEDFKYLLGQSKGLLRIELTMRGLELKKRGLSIGSSWRDKNLSALVCEAISKLEMKPINLTSLAHLPSRLKGIVARWQGGEKLVRSTPLRTFQRWRKELLTYGIDISTTPQLSRIQNEDLFDIKQAIPEKLPENIAKQMIFKS